jgi:hypothetical protein
VDQPNRGSVGSARSQNRYGLCSWFGVPNPGGTHVSHCENQIYIQEECRASGARVPFREAYGRTSSKFAQWSLHR